MPISALDPTHAILNLLVPAILRALHKRSAGRTGNFSTGWRGRERRGVDDGGHELGLRANIDGLGLAVAFVSADSEVCETESEGNTAGLELGVSGLVYWEEKGEWEAYETSGESHGGLVGTRRSALSLLRGVRVESGCSNRCHM